MRSAIRPGSGRRNPAHLPEPRPAMHPADRRAAALLALSFVATLLTLCWAVGGDAARWVLRVAAYTAVGLVAAVVVVGVVSLAVALVLGPLDGSDR